MRQAVRRQSRGLVRDVSLRPSTVLKLTLPRSQGLMSSAVVRAEEQEEELRLGCLLRSTFRASLGD